MKENDFTLKTIRNRRYHAEIITDADYADDVAFLASASAQTEYQLNRLEQTVRCIAFYVNSDKIELMCFNQYGAISLNGKPMKLVDQFMYLVSDISSIEKFFFLNT